MSRGCYIIIIVILVLFLMTSCSKPLLYLASDEAKGHWRDDVMLVEVRVQWDLLAVATLTNISNKTQLFPEPMVTRNGSWEIVDADGIPLDSNLVEALYSWDNLPMIELAPARSYSEAINLRSAFPRLQEGDYYLRFSIRGDPRDRSTWKSETQLPDIRLQVGSSPRGIMNMFG